MGVRRPGFEFRMELAAQKPGMVLDFHDFHQPAVGGGAGDLQTRRQ